MPPSPGGKRLNPAAFQAAPSGTQGTLGRNSITGFGMGQVDLALRREFRFRDRKVLQVRLEAFNVLNEANFADPVKFLSSAVVRPIHLDVEPDARHRQSGQRPVSHPADRRTEILAGNRALPVLIP